jgi:hypothetical protein
MLPSDKRNRGAAIVKDSIAVLALAFALAAAPMAIPALPCCASG